MKFIIYVLLLTLVIYTLSVSNKIKTNLKETTKKVNFIKEEKVVVEAVDIREDKNKEKKETAINKKENKQEDSAKLKEVKEVKKAEKAEKVEKVEKIGKEEKVEKNTEKDIDNNFKENIQKIENSENVESYFGEGNRENLPHFLKTRNSKRKEREYSKVTLNPNTKLNNRDETTVFRGNCFIKMHSLLYNLNPTTKNRHHKNMYLFGIS